MRQILLDMSWLSLIYLFFIVILVLICIIAIGQIIATVYIEKNKNSLFEKTKPLSDNSTRTSIKLLDELPTFQAYINEMELNQKYDCSNIVVSNAANHVVKYLIKYANLKYDEHNLEIIDYCIEWMKKYEHTKKDIRQLTEEILAQLPLVIRLFASSTYKLVFKVCEIPYEIAEYKEPQFIFSYISPAGRSIRTLDIDITSSILLGIRSEIYAKMSKEEHGKTQRAAMTNELRESIKKRDNYTCCMCGNSIFKEPNLLLEVDHIIPVSKGGKTEASNLQTLCWRCNRKKGNKT